VVVPGAGMNSIKAIPAASFAARLKEFIETRDVLFTLGLVGMVIMLSIGVFSWFRTSEAMQLADILSAFGEAFMVREAPRLRAIVFIGASVGRPWGSLKEDQLVERPIPDPSSSTCMYSRSSTSKVLPRC